MRQNKLGKTGLRVSEIGFGCWAIGGNAYGNSYGETDDEVSKAALRRALDDGAREAGALEARVEVAADLLVLDDLVGEGAVRVPVRVPAADHAEPEADGVCLLSHGAVG